MADVPSLDHLWDGQKDCLDVGQVRCFHEETSRKLPFLEGRYKGERQNSNHKEPCLTPTLMDERQAKEP